MRCVADNRMKYRCVNHTALSPSNFLKYCSRSVVQETKKQINQTESEPQPSVHLKMSIVWDMHSLFFLITCAYGDGCVRGNGCH